MRLFLTFAALLGVLAIPSSAHADITYTIHDVFGLNSVNGTITTDGTIGVLDTSDITGFNVTVNDGTNTDTITSANGQEIIQGSSVTATATGLFFDFSASNDAGFDLQKPTPGTGANFLCYQDAKTACILGSTPSSEVFSEADGVNQFDVRSGVEEIASAAPSAVPEPSSIVLLGTGLFGFAGAACRKFLKA
jgi:PEP-CTERM motif